VSDSVTKIRLLVYTTMMCNKISVLQNAHIDIHIHIALSALNMSIIFIKIYEIYEM